MISSPNFFALEKSYIVLGVTNLALITKILEIKWRGKRLGLWLSRFKT
jgi:hypothetical protein